MICLFQEMIKLANLTLDYIAHSNASGAALRIVTQLASGKPELGLESKYWRWSRFFVAFAIRLSPNLLLEVGHTEAKKHGRQKGMLPDFDELLANAERQGKLESALYSQAQMAAFDLGWVDAR